MKLIKQVLKGLFFGFKIILIIGSVLLISNFLTVSLTYLFNLSDIFFIKFLNIFFVIIFLLGIVIKIEEDKY